MASKSATKAVPEEARPTFIQDFIDEVLVECPACGHVAIVTAKGGAPDSGPAFRCVGCGFARTGWPLPDRAVVDAVAKRRCVRCGLSMEKRRARIFANRKAVVLACLCKARMTIDLHWEATRIGQPTDPYFGYPLWLQKGVGGDVLWAYNRRHLTFLRAYVGAKIRPRTPHWNGSLVSRLPAWLKNGTRRPAILRAIAALERR